MDRVATVVRRDDTAPRLLARRGASASGKFPSVNERYVLVLGPSFPACANPCRSGSTVRNGAFRTRGATARQGWWGDHPHDQAYDLLDVSHGLLFRVFESSFSCNK